MYDLRFNAVDLYCCCLPARGRIVTTFCYQRALDRFNAARRGRGLRMGQERPARVMPAAC